MTKHSVTRRGELIEFDSPYDDATAIVRLADFTDKDPAASAFALDLVATDRPSRRQLEWIHYLVREYESPRVTGLRCPNVFKLFESAVEHGLKRPVIRAQAPGLQPIKLKLANPQSKYPGSILVLSGDGEQWFGRIHTDATYEERVSARFVRALLVLIEDDPIAFARAYGNTTGRCCFCGRLLTRHESVDLGYGPICAEKFGLYWGETRGKLSEKSQHAG